MKVEGEYQFAARLYQALPDLLVAFKSYDVNTQLHVQYITLHSLFHLHAGPREMFALLWDRSVVAVEEHSSNCLTIAMRLSARYTFDPVTLLMLSSSPTNTLMAPSIHPTITVDVADLVLKSY